MRADGRQRLCFAMKPVFVNWLPGAPAVLRTGGLSRIESGEAPFEWWSKFWALWDHSAAAGFRLAAQKMVT